MGKIPRAPAKKMRTKVLLRKRVLCTFVSITFAVGTGGYHSPVDKTRWLVRHPFLDHESGGQSGASDEQAVDSERPSDS